MAKAVRKTDLRSNSFESFARAREQQPVLRNRRASISSYPERTRSPSICLSDDSWVYSPQQKVEWVDETKVNDCRGCSKPFSMIVRKHHCRNCGDVFCGTCSSFKILLPSYTERQRVCLHCVTHLAADCRLPPRSPDAPGYPSELAVNTSLPDDLDNLFDEIIENEKEEGEFQGHPITKPRRAVSSVSRPPRKLFSSVLPVPPSDDDEDSEIEQTTTIKFGTENFNKTVSALATISESQLNANLDQSMDADNCEIDEPKRKISFSSLRPPRKSFSQSSPLKQQRTSIISDDVENIRPHSNDILVYRADTVDVGAKDAGPVTRDARTMFSPGPKDSFHTLSPIVPHSPEADKANRYCESTVTFSPAAKLITGDIDKDSPLVKIVQATPVKTTAADQEEAIRHVEAVAATSSEKPVKSSGKLKMAALVACIALLLIGGLVFAFTGSKTMNTRVTKIELKSMMQEGFEFTKGAQQSHAERQVEKINLDEYALKTQEKPKKGFNIADFGMYEDIIDIPDVAEEGRSHASSKKSFVPRSTTASTMTVFKKRTYQMLSDSIQSHTVNSFVNMLRELYRRIKDLNLLKRLDVFIRGVVLSVVNSGQERIPAHI